MDVSRFRTIMGTFVLCLGMWCGTWGATTIVCERMGNNNNQTIQIMKNESEERIQIMKNESKERIQVMKNESEEKQKRMSNEDKQKDRELLISLFENNGLSLSGEDTAKIMAGYFDSTVSRNLVLVRENPFKEVFKNVPQDKIQQSDLTIESVLPPLENQKSEQKVKVMQTAQETEQNIDQETEEDDNSFSPR